MKPKDDLIDRLCRKFRDDETVVHPSHIAQFAGQAPEELRDDLTTRLVSIDIELRSLRGEKPAVVDYSTLGERAVERAEKELQDATRDVELPATVVPEFDQSATVIPDESNRSQPPTQIGPYRILKQIGRGGMGSVWLAEQSKPVRRRVALKLIRADIDCDAAMARFDAERQAIAMMDHQNIARILDAGTTENGMPYFVMEFVDGVQFDKYCDSNQLGILDRLRLMVPVCRAVQHAHQKGIIHRDIKPSNVVVATYDGQPVPKVIDFGLAKALDSHNLLTDETLNTEFGHVIGTLQYVSPEQAIGDDVDTRADVYSLGVMLYKLLTGSTPLQRNALSDQSLLHVLEIIRQKDPPRPSQRLLSDSQSTASISESRGESAEKLRQSLEGDIDWIVMKALEKNRNQRYETANGLARDIERFLNHEEVTARPPSNVYRIRKFVQRNRGLVASLIAVAVLLVAGIAGTATGLIWALDERDRANAKTEDAFNEAERANLAEERAQNSEAKSRAAKEVAEAQLYAMRMNSAWTDWQLGNVEPAWRKLNAVGGKGGWESRFLEAQFSTSQQTLYGHTMSIRDIDVSADGKFIATAGGDHRVRVWNARTKTLVYVKQLDGFLECIRFSPDSRFIACGSFGNKVSIWEVGSQGQFKQFGPFGFDVSSLAFLGSDTLVVGLADKDLAAVRPKWANRDAKPTPPEILLISKQDGAILHKLAGHKKSVSALACLTDQELIISGSHDNTLRIWKPNDEGVWTGEAFGEHAGEVTGIAISRSGALLASSGRDKVAKVWDLNSKEQLGTLVGHTDDVVSVCFSPDGQHLATGGGDSTARLWTIDGKEKEVYRGHFEAVNAVKFSAAGDQLITCSDDSTARVWDTQGDSRLITRHNQKSTVWQGDFSTDGSIVVVGNEDRTIARINAQTGELIGLADTGSEVLSIAWSPVADVFVTGDAAAELKVWNGADGSLLKTISAHEHFIWDADFSADGRWLATASADRTAKIWDTRDWSLRRRIDAHRGELGSARFSPDGNQLLTAGDDAVVKLWDCETGKLQHEFTGHRQGVWRAVFSGDRKLIASSGYDGTIVIWDAVTLEQKHKIDAHNNQIAGLTFAEDSSRLVTASDDGTIKIFDVRSGVELFLMHESDGSSSVHVSFSRDFTKLLSGNSKGAITIRSAVPRDGFVPVFLPEDALTTSIDDLDLVSYRNANVKQFQGALDRSIRCCNTFPSYDSWTVRGIAEYRLGHFSEAADALAEALYLQPIEYGQPDFRPDALAYLALAYHRLGKLDLARKTRKSFDARRSAGFWEQDELLMTLAQEIEMAFDEAKPKADESNPQR